MEKYPLRVSVGDSFKGRWMRSRRFGARFRFRRWPFDERLVCGQRRAKESKGEQRIRTSVKFYLTGLSPNFFRIIR